ncbi:MAG: hypothetical protein MZU91_13310 [Desulfosudis oleivorans]|nr:hypothetical protein [Desulfosudis oleivorans]
MFVGIAGICSRVQENPSNIAWVRTDIGPIDDKEAGRPRREALSYSQGNLSTNSIGSYNQDLDEALESLSAN